MKREEERGDLTNSLELLAYHPSLILKELGGIRNGNLSINGCHWIDPLLLRSQVPLPPSHFLSVIELRHYFELILDYCRTKTPAFTWIHQIITTHSLNAIKPVKVSARQIQDKIGGTEKAETPVSPCP